MRSSQTLVGIASTPGRMGRVALNQESGTTTGLQRLCLVVLTTVMLGCAPIISRQQSIGLAAVSSVLLAHPEGDIPPSSWPEAVVSLKPKRVYRTREGVYLCTYKLLVEEGGVFILEPASSFLPSRRGDPSYDVVAGGIFTYRSAGYGPTQRSIQAEP